MRNQQKQAGFTLVELAIVLVIIGLIVSGVLVGQDMIKGATIRSAVNQLEQYETATNTFRGKFGGLPGDIRNPVNFGLNATGLTGVDRRGDGDGIIEASAGGNTEFDFEAAAFFVHLAEADMIGDALTADAATSFATNPVDTLADYVPNSRLGTGSIVAVREVNGQSSFILGAPTLANGIFTFTAGAEVRVVDIAGVDQKVDDGLPTTGIAVAVTNFGTADAGAAAADDICVNTTAAPAAYNMGTVDRQNDRECTLRIRASF